MARVWKEDLMQSFYSVESVTSEDGKANYRFYVLNQSALARMTQDEANALVAEINALPDMTDAEMNEWLNAKSFEPAV